MVLAHYSCRAPCKLYLPLLDWWYVMCLQYSVVYCRVCELYVH